MKPHLMKAKNGNWLVCYEYKGKPERFGTFTWKGACDYAIRSLKHTLTVKAVN